MVGGIQPRFSNRNSSGRFNTSMNDTMTEVVAVASSNPNETIIMADNSMLNQTNDDNSIMVVKMD